jgi:hypothetical protein
MLVLRGTRPPDQLPLDLIHGVFSLTSLSSLLLTPECLIAMQVCIHIKHIFRLTTPLEGALFTALYSSLSKDGQPCIWAI